MSEIELRNKIKYLSEKVKSLGSENNWFTEGMKNELKNLKRKLYKKQNKKQ
jgi:hypothetical protein